MGERDAAVLMKTLIKAIMHWHANDIMHRDIKLENIMFSNKDVKDYQDVKIIDFGLAQHVDNKYGLSDAKVGSPYFTAPDVIKGYYGKEWDVWSLGVVLYVLLSGHYPFKAKRHSVIQHVIVNNPVEFPRDYWRNISDEAKDLIERMLCKTPLKRYTLEQCLKHEWFKNQIGQDEQKSNESVEQYAEIVEKLKKYTD